MNPRKRIPATLTAILACLDRLIEHERNQQ